MSKKIADLIWEIQSAASDIEHAASRLEDQWDEGDALSLNSGDIKHIGLAMRDCKEHFNKMRDRDPYEDEYSEWIVKYVNSEY